MEPTKDGRLAWNRDKVIEAIEGGRDFCLTGMNLDELLCQALLLAKLDEQEQE